MRIKYGIAATILAILLCGCKSQVNVPETTENQQLTAAIQETQAENPQMLHLTVTAQEDALTEVVDEEICETFNAGVRFQGVENVMISLDGETISLEKAIRQGKITPEFVRYACSQDVKNGYCIRQQSSWHGLDNLYFHYPEYSVLVVDDVLEGPKGVEYPVTYLVVYNHLGQTPIIDDFTDQKTGLSVTREDWGLWFSAEIEEDKLKLLCTQKNGMAVGTLRITECVLLDEAGGIVPLPYQDNVYLYIGDGLEIQPNADTEMTIPLEEALPEDGRYLYLMVADCYDSNKIHPLIEKYHSSQSYRIKLPETKNR